MQSHLSRGSAYLSGLDEMMHTQNTELMLSRPILKGFLWLGFFVFHSNTTGIAQVKKVEAKVGEVATLPCDNNLRLNKPLEHYNVYWQKFVGPGQTDEVAISYWKGQEDIKHANYMKRTTMDQQNFTLWISSVKMSDEGKYTCIILNNTTYRTELYLSVVVDFSEPVIRDVQPACGSTLLTLTCSSHGGYPEPTISGLLNNNKVEWTPISRSDNQTKLFNITSNWQVNVTEDIFFVCSVSYLGFRKSTSYNYTKPKECPGVKPLPHWIVIASSVSIVCVVVAAALANIQCCKRHRSLCRARSHQPVARSELITGAALTPLQFSGGTSEK